MKQTAGYCKYVMKLNKILTLDDSDVMTRGILLLGKLVVLLGWFHFHSHEKSISFLLSLSCVSAKYMKPLLNPKDRKTQWVNLMHMGSLFASIRKHKLTPPIVCSREHYKLRPGVLGRSGSPSRFCSIYGEIQQLDKRRVLFINKKKKKKTHSYKILQNFLLQKL